MMRLISRKVKLMFSVFIVYSCLQLSIPSTAPVYTEALLHRCQVLGENETTGSDWSATYDICLTLLEGQYGAMEGESGSLVD